MAPAPAKARMPAAGRRSIAGNGLVARIASAAVLMPVAVLAAWFGGWPFDLLVTASAVLLLSEWCRLTDNKEFYLAFALKAALLAATLLAAPAQGFLIAFIALLFAVPVAALVARALKRPPDWAATGMLYFSLPALALMWLRASPAEGRELVLWLFAVVWATDVGAYAAGRAIGGLKLAPRLSPNKTWAGLAGGVAAAAVTGAGVAVALDGAVVPTAAVSGGLALIEQAGDLAESAVKRHFGVKDTGTLIPGHGGLMDRLDGLLFVAPAVALIVLLSGGAAPWR